MSRSLARGALAAARALTERHASSSCSFSAACSEGSSIGLLWRRSISSSSSSSSSASRDAEEHADRRRRRHCRSFASSAAAAAAPSNQLQLIKALREKSGAPVTDVKAALVEAEWDEEAAFSALRKRGLAAAAKKASRRAAEGWVSVARSPRSSPAAAAAALAEVNCETDFAARNGLLTSLASDAATAALLEENGGVFSSGSGNGGGGGGDAVEASSVPALASLCSDGAAAAAAVVRENVVVRRVARLSVGNAGGVIGSYVHSPVTAGASVGRMAGLVALEPLEANGKGSGGGESLASLADKLAMHVVAARPLALDRGSLPPQLVESERAIAAAQAASSGKPAAIVAKIVEGRLGKWYEEVCLLEQRLVMDDSVTVAAAAKKEGARVVGFARLQVGEGLEKEAGGADSGEDFKSEVERLAGV